MTPISVLVQPLCEVLLARCDMGKVVESSRRKPMHSFNLQAEQVFDPKKRLGQASSMLRTG
jgi:hypothetical protein